MKARYLMGAILAVLLLPLGVDSVATALPGADPPPEPEAASDVIASGGIINIAVTGSDESDPAVAMCASGQYLAVYVMGGRIYGQRLTGAGALLGGAFAISDGLYPATHPDVACEWTNDTFVVVWESEYGVADHDIAAQAVYGAHQGGSQLKGSVTWILYALNEQQNPAIACNSSDQTCLVVYEHDISGDRTIDGRRVAVSGADITVPQAAFVISSSGLEEYNPDVAWSGASGNFAVVWQHWFEGYVPYHWALTFRRIHDTHQAGDQWQAPEYGLILGTCGGYNYDQSDPAIAYSRGADEFLVAYEYDRLGNDSNYDIAALRLQPDGTRGCPFWVAETAAGEISPAVAYSGGPEHFADRQGNPQFLISFVRAEESDGVLAVQAVKDRDDGSLTQFDGSLRELDRVACASGGGVARPDVTGSALDGQYLTVWQHAVPGVSPDQNVLGHRVAPYGGVLSYAGISFTSADSDNSYTYWTWGGVRLTAVDGGGPWPFMTAPVHLPLGAVVTSVTLYYEENDAVDDIQLYLVQYDRVGGSRTMAFVESAGGGVGSVTDTSIVSATVSNASYGYALVAYWEDINLTLYGAKITYIPNADAPLGPFDGLPAVAPAADPVGIPVDDGLEVGATALQTGGEVVFQAPASEAAADGLSLLGGGGGAGFDWARYTVAGSNFHPSYSGTSHSWDYGGGRYVSAGITFLVAPLNLIHGKRIQQARCTYYDGSGDDPDFYLYRVDRQGNGVVVWSNTTASAAGGFFTVASPYLGEVVDNQNYAYFFTVALGSSAAGEDLQVMEVEISYVTEVFLPLILRNS